jgi:hypothetical protein
VFSWLPNLEERIISRFCAIRKISIHFFLRSPQLLHFLCYLVRCLLGFTEHLLKFWCHKTPTDNILMHKLIKCFFKSFFRTTKQKTPQNNK